MTYKKFATAETITITLNLYDTSYYLMFLQWRREILTIFVVPLCHAYKKKRNLLTYVIMLYGESITNIHVQHIHFFNGEGI